MDNELKDTIEQARDETQRSNYRSFAEAYRTARGHAPKHALHINGTTARHKGRQAAETYNAIDHALDPTSDVRNRSDLFMNALKSMRTMDKRDNKTLLTLIAHHLYNAPDDAWGVFERNNLQRLHDLVVDEYHRSLLKKGEDVAGEKSAIYAGIRTTTRENGQITNTIKAGIDEYNDIINTDTRDQYPPALRIQATEATTFLSKLFTRYGTHTVLNPTDDAIIDTGKAYQTGQRSISIADRDKGKLWAHAKHTLTAGTIDGNQARRALACIALADSLGTSHAQHALKQGIKSNPHLYKTFEDELLEYGLI